MKRHKYIDTFVGSYTDCYPILSLSPWNTVDHPSNTPERLLGSCLWFQCVSNSKKDSIVETFKVLAGLGRDMITSITAAYPKLYVQHLSIGGSYLYKSERISDIDATVIVKGSYFSYIDTFVMMEVQKRLPIPVKKISLMIFGEDDFLFRTHVRDTIEVEDYIHTSLCMREGLVVLIRNVPLYGYVWEPRDLDRNNLLVRIKRQLFHAQLMIEGEVDLHRSPDARLRKSIGRIAEAFLYLSIGFPQLSITIQEVHKREALLSLVLSRRQVIEWLHEANRYIETLFEQTQRVRYETRTVLTQLQQ